MMIAGDDLCIICGWPVEILDVDDDNNFCLECYATAKAAITPSYLSSKEKIS
jgi:hypothetical protein